MFRVCAVVALTVLALCLTPIRAQGGIVLTEKTESRWRSGVCLFGAASRGELKDVFGTGFGIDVSGVFRLDRSGLFGLRIQGLRELFRECSCAGP